MTLTLIEAADLLGIPAATVRTWVNRGQLKPIKPGARPLRFHLGDVLDARYAMTSKARHARLDAWWADVVAKGVSSEYDDA